MSIVYGLSSVVYQDKITVVCRVVISNLASKEPCEYLDFSHIRRGSELLGHLILMVAQSLKHLYASIIALLEYAGE